MSKNVAKENGFKIKKSNIKIKTADDKVVRPVGQTEKLPVRIGNHVHDIAFTVMDQDSHPILLGNDWLTPTNAYVHPFGNRIVFKQRSINTTGTYADEPQEEEIEEHSFSRMTEYDDSIDQIGLDPSETKPIEINIVTKLNKNQQVTWENEIRPLIVEKSSTGSHDLGMYTQGEMVISAYASPAILAKKQNGKKRLVHDFRGVNNVIKAVLFPIMLIIGNNTA